MADWTEDVDLIDENNWFGLTVKSGGKALRSFVYQVPEGSKLPGVAPGPLKLVCAVPMETLCVEITALPDFHFWSQKTDGEVAVFVYVDGTKVGLRCFSHNRKSNRPWVIDSVVHADKDCTMQFATPEIMDEDVRLRDFQNTVTKVGTISVEVFEVTAGKSVTPYSCPRNYAMHNDKVEVPKAKKKFVGLGTTFGDATGAASTTLISRHVTIGDKLGSITVSYKDILSLIRYSILFESIPRHFKYFPLDDLRLGIDHVHKMLLTLVGREGSMDLDELEDLFIKYLDNDEIARFSDIGHYNNASLFEFCRRRQITEDRVADYRLNPTSSLRDWFELSGSRVKLATILNRQVEEVDLTDSATAHDHSDDIIELRTAKRPKNW